MENEYGDMDQVAGDFVDWWFIRWLYFEMQKRDLRLQLDEVYVTVLDHKVRTLFGHGAFIPRR